MQRQLVVSTGSCISAGFLFVVNLVACVAAVERCPVVVIDSIGREVQVLYVGIEGLAVDGAVIFRTGDSATVGVAVLVGEGLALADD